MKKSPARTGPLASFFQAWRKTGGMENHAGELP
jgi:hypothetical protein